MLCSTLVKDWHLGNRPLLQSGSETIVGLGIGALVALAVGLLVTRERNPAVALHAGRGLFESIGWALLLPQLLAVLGSIFQVAGVGTQVGKITTDILPHGSKFPAVVLYCVGMALFTFIMGNAFAAFPVMTAAIGWPVLITQLHGNPAVVLAVGMLAGFCGTLVTPMAANFNLVPHGAAGAEGPVRADQGPDSHGGGAVGLQHRHHLLLRLLNPPRPVCRPDPWRGDTPMPRVLLTGFEPFVSATRNPSWEAVQLVAADAPAGLR